MKLATADGRVGEHGSVVLGVAAVVDDFIGSRSANDNRGLTEARPCTRQRAIHDGQIPNDLAKREESLAGISAALSLMCNIVMAWNAGHMQGVFERERLRTAGTEPLSEDLRRIAPTGVAPESSRQAASLSTATDLDGDDWGIDRAA